MTSTLGAGEMMQDRPLSSILIACFGRHSSKHAHAEYLTSQVQQPQQNWGHHYQQKNWGGGGKI